MDWKAALWAGVISGVVAEMLMMGNALLQGQSPWALARLSAAMVLGEGVLPPPAAFDPGIVTVATIIHFMLSIVYALILAWLIRRFDWTGGLLSGAAFGLAVYLVNYHLIAPIAFPWFVEIRSGSAAVIHVLFGLAAAAAYLWLRKPTPALRQGSR